MSKRPASLYNFLKKYSRFQYGLDYVKNRNMGLFWLLVKIKYCLKKALQKNGGQHVKFYEKIIHILIGQKNVSIPRINTHTIFILINFHIPINANSPDLKIKSMIMYTI